MNSSYICDHVMHFDNTNVPIVCFILPLLCVTFCQPCFTFKQKAKLINHARTCSIFLFFKLTLKIFHIAIPLNNDTFIERIKSEINLLIKRTGETVQKRKCL